MCERKSSVLNHHHPERKQKTELREKVEGRERERESGGEKVKRMMMKRKVFFQTERRKESFELEMNIKKLRERECKRKRGRENG